MKKNKSNYKKNILILINSIIMLFVTYLWINTSFVTSNEEGFLSKLVLANVFHKTKDHSESVVFINVAYDKKLIEIKGRYEKRGNTSIVDRQKLIDFFGIVNKKNLQKSIVLNVNFSNKYKTKKDSVLVNVLLKTNKLILAQPPKKSIIHPLFSNFDRGYLTYTNFISSSNQFNKIQFIDKTQKSIPLLLYEILDNKTIEERTCFYTSDEKICYKSGIVNIETSLYEDKISDLGEEIYYDLGVLLKTHNNSQIESIINDKIVIIGDLCENDIHSTFWGNTSGSVILYNAYLHLKNGKHIVKLTLIIFLFIFYLLLSYFFVYNYKIYIPKSLLMSLFTDVLSVSFAFIIVNILIYFLFGVYLNILLLIVYSILFKYFIKYKLYKNEN